MSGPAVWDPVEAGLAHGWRVIGGVHGSTPTNACGGITAEVRTPARLSVVIVEEGR